MNFGCSQHNNCLVLIMVTEDGISRWEPLTITATLPAPPVLQSEPQPNLLRRRQPAAGTLQDAASGGQTENRNILTERWTKRCGFLVRDGRFMERCTPRAAFHYHSAPIALPIAGLPSKKERDRAGLRWGSGRD